MELKVRLANQRLVTISDCLKDVDITFEGKSTRTNVWLHDDSPMDDLSLGKTAMFELGFGLSGLSGKSIWTTPDPLAVDPTDKEEMSSFFSRKRAGNSSGDQLNESIARVSAPCSDSDGTIQ